MIKTDIAWAAGLFEGEGSVFMTKKDGIGIALGITDRDVIENFSKITGIKINGPYTQRLSTKPIWMCQTTGIYSVQEILRKFWPYLGERRRAKIADCFSLYYESPKKRKVRRVN